MSSTSPNRAAPSEPDPQEWLTLERRALLKRQFEPCAALLRQSGLWRAALGYWVRWQGSLDADWPAVDEQLVLDQLLQQWHTKHTLEAEGLTDEELRAKLRVAPAAAFWSRQQWGYRMESLYLQSKSRLDRASCRILRLKNKNLALELYHRIKSGETSFENAARDYGHGPERHQGGLLPMQSFEQIPFGLASLLERLEVGRLSMPLRLGPGFCLVRLESYEPSQLDARVENLLMAEQLRLWIDSVVDVLVADLKFSNP